MNNDWLTIEREGGRVILKKCSQEAEGKVIIPDGVTEIAINAFNGCHKVNEVHIPNGVKTIGENAFIYCGLTSINLPSSVTQLKPSTNPGQIIITSPFYGNPNLTSITVDKKNPVYDSRNDCNAIIETSTNRLILGCKSTTIPNTISIIGNASFFKFDKPLIIPKSVKMIEHFAFYYCSSPLFRITNRETKFKSDSFCDLPNIFRGGSWIKDRREKRCWIINHGLSGFLFCTPKLMEYYTTSFYTQLCDYFCCNEKFGNHYIIKRLSDNSCRRYADELPSRCVEENFMFASILLYMIIVQQGIINIAPESADDFHQAMGWPKIERYSDDGQPISPLDLLKESGLYPKIYEIPLFLKFVEKTFYIFRVEINTLLKGKKHEIIKDQEARERFLQVVKDHKKSRFKKYLNRKEKDVLANLFHG